MAATVVVLSLPVSGLGLGLNAKVSAPMSLTSYSRGADGRISYPGLGPRTFKKPSEGLDLNVGFDCFVPKDEQDSSIDPILNSLREAKIPMNKDFHFVSFRNNLNKIFETPYNRKNPWRIQLHRKHGTIFMNVVKLDDAWGGNLQDQKKFMYWGYKFEDYCCSQEKTDVVDANVEYCNVCKLSVGDNRLILASEIDSSLEGPGGDLQSFVEIKTSRIMEHPRQIFNFERFKLLKFWIQSFLGGVPTICCGFRDDAGIIQKVELYKTLELPRMVRNKKDMWDARTCIDFTSCLLSKVRENTEEDRQYELRFEAPFTHVNLIKLDDSAASFLPE